MREQEKGQKETGPRDFYWKYNEAGGGEVQGLNMDGGVLGSGEKIQVEVGRHACTLVGEPLQPDRTSTNV